MEFDGIILDVDGTIWDSTEIVADGWNRAIEELFPFVNRVSADILKAQFGKTMAEIAENLFPELNDREKQILIKKCSFYEEKFLEENTKNITYAKVIETIKNLAEKTKLYIVSNCHDGYIDLVCKKNGICEYIVDSECYGHNGKSKAENIKLIISRNCILAPVYVGDTQGDCDACIEAGVKFIWASYGFGKDVKGFYRKINSFDELLYI